MDFTDLNKKDLRQKMRKMRNTWKRHKIRSAVDRSMYEGTSYYIDKIDGVEFIGQSQEADCFRYFFWRR